MNPFRSFPNYNAQRKKGVESVPEDPISNVDAPSLDHYQDECSVGSNVSDWMTHVVMDDTVFLRDNVRPTDPMLSIDLCPKTRNENPSNDCLYTNETNPSSPPPPQRVVLDVCNIDNLPNEHSKGIKCGKEMISSEETDSSSHHQVAELMRNKLRDLEEQYRAMSARMTTNPGNQQFYVRYQRRSKIFVMMTVLFVVLGTLLIALVISLAKGRRTILGEPQDSSTVLNFSDLNGTRLHQLYTIIGSYSSFDPFHNPKSYPYQTLHWMAYHDLANLDISSTPEHVLLERYVVALLYFTTNGSNWRTQLDYLTPQSICYWNEQTRNRSQGIIGCEDDSVVGIYIESNKLNGTIPTELALLTNLTVLWVDDNDLIGTLPNELSTLSNLTIFSIVGNSITGTIPAEYGDLTSLRYLGIAETGSNGITGSLPSELAKLQSLEHLWLHGNGLTGSVPFEYGNLLTASMSFRIETNSLNTSFLDVLWPNLHELQTLRLESNALTGTLDPIFCSANQHNDGFLSYFSSDCGGDNPNVVCSCCTACFDNG